MLKVNDFEASEISLKLGKIKFANKKSAGLEMSIWYFPKEDLPKIIELDIDVEAEKPLTENDNIFEEFPISKVEPINELYTTLQDKNIGVVDLETSKTKTDLAYEWKHEV